MTSKISTSTGLIRAAKAAKMLGLSKPTLRKYAQAGRIAGAYRIDGEGEWRFTATAIQAFKRELAAPPATTPSP